MNTFLLSDETAKLPIEQLINQSANGLMEIRDAEGAVVAFVLSPHDREAWTYLEAHFDTNQHQDQIREAAKRRNGITTKELLIRARRAAEEATYR